MATFTCTKCGETKNLDQFPKTDRYLKGHINHCRSCFNTANKVSHLRNWYGLTVEEYNELYDFQNGACAICERPFTDTGDAKENVDHIKFGRTRGLLCTRCNTFLGRVNDDPDYIRRFIQYLALPPADEIWDEPKIGPKQREARPNYRHRPWRAAQ